MRLNSKSDGMLGWRVNCSMVGDLPSTDFSGSDRLGLSPFHPKFNSNIKLPMINPCRFSKRQSWRYIILGSLSAALSVLTIGLWILPTSASAQDKAAVLLPGSINDQSWNAQGYQGVASLKALGWDVAYSENVQPADMAQALQDYARRGYTLLIGHTGRFQSPMQLLGPKFPKVTFIIGGGDKGFGKNVASVDYNNAQFGYLKAPGPKPSHEITLKSLSASDLLSRKLGNLRSYGYV